MKTIPPEVYEYIYSIMRNYDCADNTRVYQEGDVEGAVDYEKRRARGCCGFVDYQSFRWQGQTWVFGFNYGH